VFRFIFCVKKQQNNFDLLLLAHPSKLEGAYDLARDGWLAGCPSTPEPFAFKGPSNILQRVLKPSILHKKCIFDPQY
jgi:hypothetical protein